MTGGSSRAVHYLLSLAVYLFCLNIYVYYIYIYTKSTTSMQTLNDPLYDAVPFSNLYLMGFL